MTSTTSPLHLLQSVKVDHIFSPYALRRESLIQLILDGAPVAGLWHETIFPKIKDLIRYGADKLKSSSVFDSLIDAAVDASAATLGLMAPEFLPGVAALTPAANKAAHVAKDKVLTAVRDWTLRGLCPSIPVNTVCNQQNGTENRITHGDVFALYEDNVPTK